MMTLIHSTYKKLYLWLIMPGIFAYAGLLHASQEDNTPWFEIELIVFKSTSQNGLLEESWDQQLQLNNPQELLDFLQQPIDEQQTTQQQAVENTTNGRHLLETSEPTDELIENNNNSLMDNLSVININSLEEEAKQLLELNKKNQIKPFVPLGEQAMQLLNEAKSLERHPDYKLLKHVVWRQPVENYGKAPHIRIAGGTDLSADYDYQGNKLNSDIIFNQNTQQSDTQQTENIWVPELDGNIKIYIKKYIHLSANLFLRRPGQQEITARDLSTYQIDKLAPLWGNQLPSSQTSEKPLQGQQTFQQQNTMGEINLFNQQQTTNQNLKNQPLTDNQFSWQIDDNFLQNEVEKIYIERLFNYALTQSRRLKSGELNYFDHPLFGLLVMIRPLDKP